MDEQQQSSLEFCGFEIQTVFESTGEMEVQKLKKIDELNIPDETTEIKSDVDTDSLESMSLSSPVSPEVKSEDNESIKNEIKKQTSPKDNQNNVTIQDICGSSLSGNLSLNSCDCNSSRSDSVIKNVQNGIALQTASRSKAKRISKTKPFDFSQVKARTDSHLNRQKSLPCKLSPDNRRMSESCILQTSSESHGIRETRLSRTRFEKCHENHDGFVCEGEDYLTPTQRKDFLIRDLKRQVKDLTRAIEDKAKEINLEKENFEKKLENVLAEKGTEIVILKSDIETLEKKTEDLQKSYQVSVNTINMLEDNIRELKEEIARKDKSNDQVFLETYRKGQMSALFERNEELERIAVKCDGSSITIKELIQKLLLTENELGKWQSIRRQESYDSAPKPETEAEATLRFLKDSFFHYITDAKDSDFHLRAMVRILNFTDVQKKKIKENILDKRKNKN